MDSFPGTDLRLDDDKSYTHISSQNVNGRLLQQAIFKLCMKQPAFQQAHQTIKQSRAEQSGTSSRKASPQHTRTPPHDHLFKLPAEIRNQIYGYILADQVHQPQDCKYTEPKAIFRGDETEPALLRACPQIRDEALGLYYRHNSFKLGVNMNQLISAEKWISTIRRRFDRPSTKAFGGLALEILDFELSKGDSLKGLARIAQFHFEYFNNYHLTEIDLHTAFERCVSVPCGRDKSGLHKWIFEDVVKIGNEAAHERRADEWASAGIEMM